MNWKQTLNSILAGGGLRKIPEKYRVAVRQHGASRAAAIRYLEAIGGYSSRNERYAFSWNVKAYNVDFAADNLYTHDAAGDFAHLRDKCKNDGERGVLYGYFCSVLGGMLSPLWDIATEEAWESFKEDSNTFWGDELDIEWGLAGRSGGHLVLCSVEGYDCSMRDEDLIEAMQEKESDGTYVMSHRRVATVFLLCLQTSLDWPREAVGKEVEYRAAWRVWATLDDKKLDELLSTYRHQRGQIVEALRGQDDAGEVESAIDFISTLLGQKDED